MIHTSKSLKSQDGDLDNFHYQLDDGEQYKLTKEELGWMEFVKGRYGIYEHIMDCSEENEKGELIYTMNTIELSDALSSDGIDCKAVCLSDDTALQAIFFHSSYEVEVQ